MQRLRQSDLRLVAFQQQPGMLGFATDVSQKLIRMRLIYVLSRLTIKINVVLT